MKSVSIGFMEHCVRVALCWYWKRSCEFLWAADIGFGRNCKFLWAVEIGVGLAASFYERLGQDLVTMEETYLGAWDGILGYSDSEMPANRPAIWKGPIFGLDLIGQSVLAGSDGIIAKGSSNCLLRKFFQNLNLTVSFRCWSGQGCLS
jgi:hypothetical protein